MELLDHMVACFLFFITDAPLHTFQLKCIRASVSPYPCQDLLFSDFLDNDHSHRYEVISHISVVLICIFLMITDVECLCIYLLTICISSLEICLYKSFAYFFFFWLFFFNQSNFGLLLLLLSYRNLF